eukprot:scaffold25411_cov152-Cylindrotheca_fusiformis.AAC.2
MSLLSRSLRALHNRNHHALVPLRALASLSTQRQLRVPTEANVVVVGGGIIGTSVAYHLGKLGISDVLLLEKDRLTSGTTWHAASLMTSFGSLSSSSIDMRKYTKNLYWEVLPAETGLETGFMDIGFIEVACDEDRLHYYRRVAAFNRFLGIDVEEISRDMVKEKFPLTTNDDILAGFYVADDGRANATDITMALAKGAKQYGVKIMEGQTVLGVSTTKTTETGFPKQVTGVTVANPEDPDSPIEINAPIVVNCAGMWARQFGEMAGVLVPNQAAEHYYLVTEEIPGLDPRWPVLEDVRPTDGIHPFTALPSKCIYMRPEGRGLLVGFFEREGAPWNASKIPDDFSFGQIDPDWDRMGPYLETAMERLVPEVHNVGIKTFFCGPESFTPDSSPCVGQSPDVQNYFVAAGLNSIGILTGGGIGKTLAAWIHKGLPPSDIDVTAINVDRFHSYQSNIDYRKRRVGEVLGNTYRLLYPGHQPKTCRGIKKSVFHDQLVGQNAYFHDVSGWESPGWFAPKGVDRKAVGKDTFGRPEYFPYWEAEHNACRENVALFDMSFMSKFLVQGYDAGKFLNHLSTANVDGPSSTITYTQWLNEDGYLEGDLTVTKLSEEKFLVVATDTMHNHVRAHMTSRLSRDWHVAVTDVTAQYAQLNLQGPKSRDLLQMLTSRDMSNFVFRRAEEIDIGLARSICTRITYVGELGYELFIPVEQATYVYDHITEMGESFGLQHAGLKALGSLRLEKGYRDYGHDIDTTDTVVEAGLAFTCDFEKEGGFVGREHVLAEKAEAKKNGGRFRRMASVLVPLGPADPLLYHGEVLWRNGEPISDIRSGSYGHTVGGGIGLTMLHSKNGQPINRDYIQSGHWELEIANKKYPCSVSLSSFYDPKNVRIKG